MQEIDKATYSGEEHDATHHVATLKEEQAFKREYSKPRRKWTLQDLKSRFPDDKRQGDFLIADNGLMQRVFQFFKEKDTEGNDAGIEYAHEVSRIQYDPTKSINDPFRIQWRDISGYDSEGYLTYYAVVVSNNYKQILPHDRVSYQQTYSYTMLPDGQRELAKIVTQHVTKTPDMMPALPIGNPSEVNFTDIPL